MEENKFSEFNEVKNTEIAEEKSKNNNGGKLKKKLPVVKIAILGIIVSLILVLAQFLLTGSLFTFNKMTESAKKQTNAEQVNLPGDTANIVLYQNTNQNTSQNMANISSSTNVTEQQQDKQNIPTNQMQTQISPDTKKTFVTTSAQIEKVKTNNNIEKEKSNNKAEQSKEIKKVASKSKKQSEEKENIFYLEVDEIRDGSFVLGWHEYIKGDIVDLRINGQNIKGKIYDIQNNKVKIEMTNETDKKKTTGIIEIYESHTTKKTDLDWIVR